MSHIALIKLPWVMKDYIKRTYTGRLYNLASRILKDNALPVLASFLLKHGYKASIHTIKRPEEIINIKADVYCFSLCTVDVPTFIETRRFIKKGKIILGGSHPSFDTSLLEYCDTIIIGEGENGLLCALSDLTKGKMRKIYKKPCIENLDNLPRPVWEMMDRPNQVLTIISSRGCRYRCSFCITSKLYNHTWRAMSPQRILQEISPNRKKFVIFQDDNFTLSTKRMWEFLRLKKEMGLNFKWFCFSRTDKIARNPRLFEAMVDEGCTLIYVGIESASDAILKSIKKGTTTQINKTAIEILHDCGIGVWTSVMIGPNDTKETAHKLEEFCIWAEPYLHSTSITTPFIGSDLFQDLDNQGRLLHKKWEFYDGGHCVFQPYHLSPAELESLTLQVEESVWGSIGWHKRLLYFPKLLTKFLNKPYWYLTRRWWWGEW
ncbi:MAG: B12-binding domain-containing radical SAM protein [Candidatus Hermodarchaeota archaeon]